jgi:hypothetical protein
VPAALPDFAYAAGLLATGNRQLETDEWQTTRTPNFLLLLLLAMVALAAQARSTLSR